jgi:hypothetical protein
MPVTAFLWPHAAKTAWIKICSSLMIQARGMLSAMLKSISNADVMGGLHPALAAVMGIFTLPMSATHRQRPPVPQNECGWASRSPYVQRPRVWSATSDWLSNAHVMAAEPLPGLENWLTGATFKHAVSCQAGPKHIHWVSDSA